LSIYHIWQDTFSTTFTVVQSVFFCQLWYRSYSGEVHHRSSGKK